VIGDCTDWRRRGDRRDGAEDDSENQLADHGRVAGRRRGR
jgi:hypothetical protein